MAFSIEARVPFLDHELVEFIFSLPIDQKIKGGWNRAVYRNAMKGRMPEKNRLRRSKIGFTNPDITWMKAKAPRSAPIFGVARARRAAISTTRARSSAAWDEYLAGRPGDGLIFWRVLVTELWMRRYIDQSVAVARDGRPSTKPASRARRRLRAPPGADAPHPHQGAARPGLRRVREAACCEPGDWLAVSEKFVTISQGRVIHQSVVRPGWLAKLLVKGVTKHPDDVGYSDPRKMQVAIMQAGWLRMFVRDDRRRRDRDSCSGRRGDFYRIAGHRISEIDGFNPATVKPFDEFAMLGPEDPDARRRRDRRRTSAAPVAIVDANNINVEVLGTSPGFPLDAKAVARGPARQPDGPERRAHADHHRATRDRGS